MELLINNKDFMISVGPIQFPYTFDGTLEQLTEFITEKFTAGKAFNIQMDPGNNGPYLVINPAPGAMIIVMTKEQATRNRIMNNLTKQ